MRECISHHHACDCREEAHKQELQKLHTTCQQLQGDNTELGKIMLYAIDMIPSQFNDASKEQLLKWFLESDDKTTRNMAQNCLQLRKSFSLIHKNNAQPILNACNEPVLFHS
jgi:hypothetical protein